MQKLQFRLSTPRGEVVCAAVGLACSMACLAAVLALFASASGELEPALARIKAAPAASAVATEAPARPAGS